MLVTWALGAVVVAAVAVVCVQRFDAYSHAPALPLHGVRILRLGAGDQIIFQGCPSSGSCPRLLPTQVHIVDLQTGRIVPVVPDPHRDDLGSDGIPSGGADIFHVSHDGWYRISTTASHRAGFLSVALSEGQELRSLLPWLAMLVLGIAVPIAVTATVATRELRRPDAGRSQLAGSQLVGHGAGATRSLP